MTKKIFIGSDVDGLEFKNHIKAFLYQKGYSVNDLTENIKADFVTSSNLVAKAVLKHGGQGILIDEYGMGSFMVANRHKGIICAALSDEHSARMTREHNNTSIITLGSGVVGKRIAEQIVMRFVTSDYAGGRHQIRIDMLNKLC